jgi:hypothetical protein
MDNLLRFRRKEMRTLRNALASIGVLLVGCSLCSAQKLASSALPDPANSKETRAETASFKERRRQFEYLSKATEALNDYLGTLPLASEEYKATAKTIQDLEFKRQGLAKFLAGEIPESLSSIPENVSGELVAQVHPEFSLAVPAKGRTNVATETTLTWTEDRRNGAFQNPPLYNLKGFHVVVSRSAALTNPVVQDANVAPASAKVTAGAITPLGMQSIATSFAIPANTLEPGTKYFWQVFAVYSVPGQTETLEQPSEKGPSFFITSIDPFHPLTKRNFSLQRTVDSKDPTEGAQFSFLKTFGGKNVFTTDFALFWESRARRFANNKGFVWFRPAVEGKLTSAKSTSEDAWKFTGSAVIDYNFVELETDDHNRFQTGTSVSAPRRLIDGVYVELGGGLEGSQNLIQRNLLPGFTSRPIADRWPLAVRPAR